MRSLFYATYSSLHCKTCSIDLTTTASCLSHYCTTLSVTMKTAWRSSHVSAQIRHLNEQMQSKDQLDTFFFKLLYKLFLFVYILYMLVNLKVKFPDNLMNAITLKEVT